MKKNKKSLKETDSDQLEGLYQLSFGSYWKTFKKESFCFCMIVIYITNEYLRLDNIFPALQILSISQTSLVLALLSWLSNSKEKYIPDNLFWLLVLFLLIIIISSMNAYDSSYAFSQLENYIHWVIIYFLIAQIVTTEKRLLVFISVLFLALFKISLFGAKTWAARGFAFTDWGIAGPDGYFANSGELSLLMAMFFAMSLGLYVGIKNNLTRVKKYLFLLLPLTATMTVMASSSRGSQLALLIQILIFSFLFKKITLKGVLVTALALFLTYNYMPEKQKERFRTAGTDKSSVSRLVYWEKGIEMMKNNPATGVGYENFPIYFDYYYPELKIYKGSKEVAHNHLVQVGATLGYPGLITYLVIIFACFKVSGKARKLLQENNRKESWIYYYTIGMDCALIGYFVGAMFMSVAFYPYVWIHASYIVASLNSTKAIVNNNIK